MTPSSRPAATFSTRPIIYGGGGYTETLLGEWLKNRGVREQSVIIGKGAHTPLCYPDVIGKQLTQSLDRLQTDHVDVYFMHRDNLDVPVGEFVDAMDREVKAGRIRGPFGGSNWTKERMDEAIAYADRTGKQRPGALSNHFSLAEMLTPIWAGCVTASSDDWKAMARRPADAELRLVEPGARLLYRSRRTRQAWRRGTRSRLVLGAEISDAVTERSSLRTGLARARSTWHLPTFLRSPFRPFR